MDSLVHFTYCYHQFNLEHFHHPREDFRIDKKSPSNPKPPAQPQAPAHKSISVSINFLKHTDLMIQYVVCSGSLSVSSLTSRSLLNDKYFLDFYSIRNVLLISHVLFGHASIGRHLDCFHLTSMNNPAITFMFKSLCNVYFK